MVSMVSMVRAIFEALEALSYSKKSQKRRAISNGTRNDSFTQRERAVLLSLSHGACGSGIDCLANLQLVCVFCLLGFRGRRAW